MFFLDKLLGTESDRYVKEAKQIAETVKMKQGMLSSMTLEDLQEETKDMKKELAEGASLDSLIPRAFAAVAEASKRTTGMNPFPVQIMGALALHRGAIAEMRTGEGKTLVAVPAAYLNALSGLPVHIITVNDYLARRDAVWMGQIYAALGMSVAVINAQGKSYQYDPDHQERDSERDEVGSFRVIYEFLREIPREKAYSCDVLYGTNNEYVFDYLRDNIEHEEKSLRHRGRQFAIVDEVDSILIDEARSPLIISGPVNIPASQYIEFARFAETMSKDTDYTVEEKYKSVSLTEIGIKKFEEALRVKNVYLDEGRRAIHYFQNALKAREFFKKDKQYIVQDGRIVIVDEFTGRLQHGRQWSDGLHQAVEAKEGVQVQQETRTHASITYQNYFRMYEKLAGMTGTAHTSSEEFLKVYNMSVLSLPTNRISKRIDHSDIVYQTRAAKMRAASQKIKELHERGQPVLVGTASIEQNEVLSKRLRRMKIPHEVLNAKNHEREGEIIAQAGRKGMVTVATNLAGRGVDIRLGGMDEHEAKEVCDLGGLFVLGTERHESRRIDDQLRGRCGRQGDPGETQFFVSLEDDLTRVFGSDQVRSVAKKLGLPEDQAIQNRFISKSIEGAQKRIEGHHFDARRFSLQYDAVLNTQRKDVYEKRRSVLCASSLNDIDRYLSSDLLSSLRSKHEDAAILERMKKVVLYGIDTAWVEHLELMDYARNSVGLRSYGQREPLIEYRREGNRLFEGFWERVSGFIVDLAKKEFEKEE